MPTATAPLKDETRVAKRKSSQGRKLQMISVTV
jgi:hypothetical protein